MAASLKLFIADGRLVQGFSSTQIVTTKPTLFAEDTGVYVEIHKLTANADVSQARPWAYESLGGSTRLGIGNLDQNPTAGTFVITDTEGLQNTAAIPFNASAVAVQAAVRAGLFTNYSVATVSGPDGGPWVVDRVTLNDIDPLTGNGDGLYPDAFVGVAQRRVGNAFFSKLQRIRLIQEPAAIIDDADWSSLPAAAVSILNLQTGATGANSVQQVSINADTYSGTFAIDVGSPVSRSAGGLSFKASADELETAINAAFGTGREVSVTKADNSPVWAVEFVGTTVAGVPIPAITGSAAGLKVPVGLKGYLDLNTSGIQILLDDKTSADTTLEVSNSNPNKATLYQGTVTLRNILLDSEALGATKLPEFATIGQMLAALSGASSSFSEFGVTPIPLDSETFDGVFTVTKASADWHFTGLYVRNLTDGSDAHPPPSVIYQDDEKFTVRLQGVDTSSGNYVLVWHAVLDPTELSGITLPSGVPATGANYRFVENAGQWYLQIWNPTQSAWHTFLAFGAVDEETSMVLKTGVFAP